MFKRWRFSIAFILFAVFTGAELSALMFADMAVIGGEIATTLEEDRILSSGNAEEKEMLGIYQNIAAVYGITRVGGSILEFSMTPGNIQKLGTKLKSLGKESTDKVVRGFLYLKDKAGIFKFKNLANVQELKAKFVASSRTLRLNAMAANAPPQFYTYVNNLGHVVVEEIGYGKTMVGFWAEDALTGEIHLSQIRWYDPATAGSEIKAIVTKYTNIRYEAQSGEIVVGDLEVLQLRNGGVWVRGVLQDKFYETIEKFIGTFDRSNLLSREVQENVFYLYKNRQWKNLEAYCIKNKVNEFKGRVYPPGNGGYNTIIVRLKKGDKLDRYQEEVRNLDYLGRPQLSGSFTSPVYEGVFYNYAARALSIGENENALYYSIEILEDLPIDAEISKVIPWFRYAGEGEQARFIFGKEWDLVKLIEKGFVKVKILGSPNKSLSKFIGTVY